MFKPTDALIFVHGFNTSFDDAAFRMAQIVWDLGYRGLPVLFRGHPGAGFSTTSTIVIVTLYKPLDPKRARTPLLRAYSCGFVYIESPNLRRGSGGGYRYFSGRQRLLVGRRPDGSI